MTPTLIYMVLTTAPTRRGSILQRVAINVTVCICEGTCTNIHGSCHCYCPEGFNLTEGGYSFQGIIPLLGHCVAMWYAMSRYLVKLAELETSWGCGDTVN